MITRVEITAPAGPSLGFTLDRALEALRFKGMVIAGVGRSYTGRDVTGATITIILRDRAEKTKALKILAEVGIQAED